MATKEVYFDVYCKKCKHWDKSESDDPCYDCLEDGWNEDSHKPVKFAENKDQIIELAAKELADSYKRTKAWKEKDKTK